MPKAYNVAQNQDKPTCPPLRGLLGLLAICFFIGGIMGFWVYVIPLGNYLSYSPEALVRSVSLAIGAQIVAGLCAVVLSSRIQPFIVCLSGGLLIASCVSLFTLFSSSPALYISLTVFAFVWMFVPPFQLPLLIELDPSLRSAVFIGTAQLSGAALGPALSAQWISGYGTIMAAGNCIALILSSVGLLVVARVLGIKETAVTPTINT